MFKSAQRLGAWGLLTGCALSCGGRAATSEDPTSSSTVVPLAGLYSVNIDTATDCSPAPLAHEMREEQLAPDATGVNLSFWSNAHQDVPWTGLSATLADCQSSVRIRVAVDSSRSFTVQSDWIWIDPGRCSLGADEVPRTDCTARQVATYELIDR